MWKIIIDNNILSKYNKYYFTKYPKRKKIPIEKPITMTLNGFISKVRIEQNSIKQKYKEFSIWLAEYYKINNLKLEKAKIIYKFYFKDKRRRDIDNMCISPKLINDGFVESQVFIDDSGDILKLEFDNFSYDKENPRTEIIIEKLESE